MPAYNIPPWIGQPADPAAHYSQGMQIGMRLGAEQAANVYRQQQMAREQQKTEFEAQLQSQKQDLEIDQITRKHRAISDYQSLIGQGLDPMQALQQVGPDIGVDPSHVAMVMEQKAQHAEQQKNQGAMMDFRLTQEERRQQGESRRLANEESLAESRKNQYELRSRAMTLKENATPRMSTPDRLALQALYRELATVNTALMKANALNQSDPENSPPRAPLMARKFAISNEIKRMGGQDTETSSDTSLDTGDESNVDSESDNAPYEGTSEDAPETAPTSKRLKWTPQGFVPMQ